MAESRRRTTSRRDLSRRPGFEQISPEVGELDEAAFDDLLAEQPDEAMALLADLAGATDRALAALARRLAGRVFVDLAAPTAAPRRGIGKVTVQPYQPDAGDLDLDASLPAIVEARAAGSLVDTDGLRVRAWGRKRTAWCLLVDRSGSMGGGPLASAAVAAATVAWREPADYSVVAFGQDVVVPKSQGVAKPAADVVGDLLALRGHGTTDLAGALRAAAAQLARSDASRRIAVLMSDCRATVDGDPVAAARGLGELVVIAPRDDADEATRFASLIGARLSTVAGPSTVADALNRVLSADLGL